MGTGPSLGPAALSAGDRRDAAGSDRLLRALGSPPPDARAQAPRSSSGKSVSETAAATSAGSGTRPPSPTDLAPELARIAIDDRRRGSDLEQSAAAVVASALSDRAEPRRAFRRHPMPSPVSSRPRGPGLGRPRRGTRPDRRPVPAPCGPLRPCHRRLTPGRRVPAPRRPRRPLPLRGPARHPRPRAAPRHRRRGALPVRTPAWRSRAAASSSPTATATRTGSPRPARRCSTRCRRLLDPCHRRGATGCRSRPGLTSGRDIAQVVCRPGDAPSEEELARSIAARGPRRRHRRAARDRGAAGGGFRTDRRASSPAARDRGGRTRAPGPLRNPAVIDAARLGVSAYGGTTLEGFDVCSYRWFVSHELNPQDLDPDSRRPGPG